MKQRLAVWEIKSDKLGEETGDTFKQTKALNWFSDAACLGWFVRQTFLSNFSEFSCQDETGGILRSNNVFLSNFSSFCQGHLNSRIYTFENEKVAAVSNLTNYLK